MKQKKNSEPKNSEILEAINNFATYVEKRFDKQDERFDKQDERFDKQDKRFDAQDKKSEARDEDLAFLKRNMVTKIYLDEKNGELRGDISELMYKGNRKFIELVHILENKNILSEEDSLRILSMPPFPLGQTS